MADSTTNPKTNFYYADAAPPPSAHAIGAVNLTAVIALPTGQVVELDTLSMVSISTHREKFPVGGLGSVSPRGFTLGKRMIAGTLVFAIVDRSAFSALLTPLEAPTGYVSKSDEVRGREVKGAFYNMKADELPPFDLHMVYVTQENVLCYEGLRRVTILDEGSVRSMDMVGINESYSFMATDRIPIQPLSVYTQPATLQKPGGAPTKTQFMQDVLLGHIGAGNRTA